MNSVARTLSFQTLRVAVATALAAWVALIVFGVSIVEHAERKNLDAASAIARDRLATADADAVRAHIETLRETFAPWNLTAAAFDRNGVSLGGDAALRPDGLRAGGETTPPAGRLLSVVEIRAGYVLVAPTPAYVTWVRTVVYATLAIALAASLLVTAAAYVLSIRRCARTSERLTAAFAAAGTVDDRAIAPSDDALFGPIATAASAAVERVRKAAGERAQGEERLRAFLADAGHELRTPLAIAIGYIGILQRDAIEDPELARRIVGDIATEHERLTRLVERILQLARLDAVAADPSATCDAVRVVREAIALVRPLDIEREIVLNAPESAWLAIAPDDFRDAVRNLLENALRYAPDSDVAVTIVPDSDSTLVRVADGGPGMTAFARDHAFDRFFRASASTTAIGSGLGLAIVRRIAERAGGVARLASEEGRGTVAELQLPTARST